MLIGYISFENAPVPFEMLLATSPYFIASGEVKPEKAGR